MDLLRVAAIVVMVVLALVATRKPAAGLGALALFFWLLFTR